MRFTPILAAVFSGLTAIFSVYNQSVVSDIQARLGRVETVLMTQKGEFK